MNLLLRQTPLLSLLFISLFTFVFSTSSSTSSSSSGGNGFGAVHPNAFADVDTGLTLGGGRDHGGPKRKAPMAKAEHHLASTATSKPSSSKLDETALHLGTSSTHLPRTAKAKIVRQEHPVQTQLRLGAGPIRGISTEHHHHRVQHHPSSIVGPSGNQAIQVYASNELKRQILSAAQDRKASSSSSPPPPPQQQRKSSASSSSENSKGGVDLSLRLRKRAPPTGSHQAYGQNNPIRAAAGAATPAHYGNNQQIRAGGPIRQHQDGGVQNHPYQRIHHVRATIAEGLQSTGQQGGMSHAQQQQLLQRHQLLQRVEQARMITQSGGGTGSNIQIGLHPQQHVGQQQQGIARSPTSATHMNPAIVHHHQQQQQLASPGVQQSAIQTHPHYANTQQQARNQQAHNRAVLALGSPPQRGQVGSVHHSSAFTRVNTATTQDLINRVGRGSSPSRPSSPSRKSSSFGDHHPGTDLTLGNGNSLSSFRQSQNPATSSTSDLRLSLH